MNQVNINQTIGLKFEEYFLSELKKYFPHVKSSRQTPYQYICDIVDDECLIELKSSRDAYGESTVDTFTRISKNGLNQYITTGQEKGLFFQMMNLLSRERSMIIIGCYKEEPNKLYNLWIKKPSQAFAKYTEYKIMTHWGAGSTYCRIDSFKFWNKVKTNINIRRLKTDIEDYAENTQSMTFEDHNYCYEDFYLTAPFEVFKKLTSLSEIELHEKIESIQNRDSEHNWIDYSNSSLIQPMQNTTWIEQEEVKQLEFNSKVEEDSTPSEVEEDSTPSEVEEDLSHLVNELFDLEKLKIIKRGLEDGKNLKEISIELGRCSSYLKSFMCNKSTWGKKKNKKIRDWIRSLRNNQEDLFEETDMTQDQTQDHTELQIEAYKAEIDKLKNQYRDLKTEHFNILHDKEDLEAQCEELKKTIESNQVEYEALKRFKPGWDDGKHRPGWADPRYILKDSHNTEIEERTKELTRQLEDKDLKINDLEIILNRHRKLVHKFLNDPLLG